MPHIFDFPLRTVLFLLLSALVPSALIGAGEAAFPEYSLREWHISDGLPGEEIWNLFQDTSGYLIVSTPERIYRFDGAVFSDISSALSEKAISLRSLTTDASGQWRVLPSTAIDAVYLSNNGTLKAHHVPELAGHLPKTLLIDKEGGLWLGRDDGSVLRQANGGAIVFPFSEKLEGRAYPSFATNSGGEVWVAMGGTVSRYHDGHLESLFDSAARELCLISSASGEPWIITPNSVLRRINGTIQTIAALPELLGAHYVGAGLEDRLGQLWIGTRSQGLFCLSNGELKTVATSHEDIFALYEDREGNIWVGTNGGGLNRLRAKSSRLYNRSSGLADNYSYTVAEDAEGSVWLGNRDGGVVRIRGNNIEQISRSSGWPTFSALSVYPDVGDGLWITSGMGVFKTERSHPENLLRMDSLSTFGVFRVSLVTKNGDYWVAGAPDRAVRWRNGKVRVFGQSDGFDAKEIRVFAEDVDHTVWVGANDGGLFRAIGDRFERVPFYGAKNCGTIQTIYWDATGSIVLGTTSSGLVAFHPDRPDKARVLSVEQGLPSENISVIVSDDIGQCWIGSRSGVFRISQRQLQEFIDGRIERVHATLLGKDDGVKDLSCLGMFKPSAWKTRDGNLWFATRQGILRIDPTTSAPCSQPPPVIITAIRCDDMPNKLESVISVPSSLRKLEIRYSALNLSAPERILIEHQLDGFDSHWIVQDINRSVVYPRLPPGRYTFRARSSNGSGIWNESGTLLTILVMPPWWQTTWSRFLFLATMVIVVASSARIYSHYRYHKKLDKLRRETAIERERTRIAQNIHDDLGASLTQISLLTQCAEGDALSQSASLDKIYQTAEESTRALDEIVWAVNPKYDDLDSLIYYLGNFAQNFLDAAGIGCRLEAPRGGTPVALSSHTRHNLFLCCKEALNNVVKHAHAREVTLTVEVKADTITIQIGDNGVGLRGTKPVEPAASPTRIVPGNGLQNMAQRIAEMKGTFQIEEYAGSGTLVTYTIPLRPRD